MKLSDLKNLILKQKVFDGSKNIGKKRYESGGDSGHGSFNKLAQFKAEVLSQIINKHDVKEVIEFGCGDGNQLKLYDFPNYYGLDISEVAIKKCKEIFKNDKNKSFELMRDFEHKEVELVLSIDVIYHLVEDDIYYNYLESLFNSSSDLVVIYSSNEEIYNSEFPHVKHRFFTKDIDEKFTNFSLIEHIPNKYPYNPEIRESSRADFFRLHER